MMLGSMNCQSASAASASFRISASVSSNTVASSNRCPLKWRVRWVPERPPLAHGAERFFEPFGKEMRVVQASLRDFGEDVARQQPGVFGEKAKHDAIKEARDAEVFSLRDAGLAPGLGVRKFHALALLERAGDFGNLGREVLRDLGRGFLRF